MKHWIVILLAVCSTLFVTAQKKLVKTLWIADHDTTIQGKSFLLYKSNKNLGWKVLRAEITNFTYESGYFYTLSVIEKNNYSMQALTHKSYEVLKITHKQASKNNNHSIPNIAKINASWKIESVEKDILTVKKIEPISYIQINQQKQSFSGNGACNSIGGKVVIKGNRITFSQIIRTEMYCDQMSQEDLFLAILEMANRFELTDQKLVLYKEQKKLMTLHKQQ